MIRQLFRGGLVSLGLCTSMPAQGTIGEIKLDLALRVPATVANLGSVGTFLHSRDGGLAIVDFDANGIRFFSPSGAETGVFGRRGEGPGEFRTLNSIGWVGDTLWVSDYGLRRITFISPSRKLIRIAPFPIVKPPVDELGVVFSSATISAVYPDGSLALSVPFARVSKLPEWASGHTLRDIPTLRFSSARSRIWAIGWIPSSELCDVRYETSNGFGAVGIPFCEPSLWGNSPDGSVFAAVEIGPIAKGEDTYHVVVTTSSGKRLFSRDYGFVPRLIPARIADSVGQRIKSRLRDDPAGLRAYSSVQLPYAYPPLRTLLVGSDSTLWLEQRTSGDTHRWIALNTNGTPVGTFELPHNTALVAADRRSIWVTEMNEDGVMGWARFTTNRKQ